MAAHIDPWPTGTLPVDGVSPLRRIIRASAYVRDFAWPAHPIGCAFDTCQVDPNGAGGSGRSCAGPNRLISVSPGYLGLKSWLVPGAFLQGHWSNCWPRLLPAP